MPVSQKVHTMIEGSSWVRRMFEDAARMKRQFGEDRVLDFTLGNPVDEPPPVFKEALMRLAQDPAKGVHRYMPNHGFPETRAYVAERLRAETGMAFTENHVVMTVGAAGGLNVALKAILDPGDEVIVPVPYFVEFKFYTENHGGVMVPVETKEDFSLNLEKVEEAITERTRAIIINSPNNPTGAVYTQEELQELCELLQSASRKNKRVIYLLSDDTYWEFLYDGLEPVNVFSLYPAAISVRSYSKCLFIPGERIGFVAVNPQYEYAGRLMEALIFANRVLGFVNAPALMQRAIVLLKDYRFDPSDYQQRRDAIYQALVDSGFQVQKPKGAFYVFPKVPVEDDVAFVRDLQNNHHLLVVPGSGFGKPGHVRLSFCVDMSLIEKARERLQEVGKKYGLI